MSNIEFDIEDEAHAEPMQIHFSSFDDALSGLKELAKVPYGESPNKAPCSSWKTCHRLYEIVEYDKSTIPWKEIDRTEVLEISAVGVKWLI